jgi:hypothetical protein
MRIRTHRDPRGPVDSTTAGTMLLKFWQLWLKRGLPPPQMPSQVRSHAVATRRRRLLHLLLATPSARRSCDPTMFGTGVASGRWVRCTRRRLLDLVVVVSFGGHAACHAEVPPGRWRPTERVSTRVGILDSDVLRQIQLNLEVWGASVRVSSG